MRIVFAGFIAVMAIGAGAQDAVFTPNTEARNFIQNIEVVGMAHQDVEPNFVNLTVTFSEEATSTQSAIDTIIQKTNALVEALAGFDEESLEVTLDRYQIEPTYEGLLWDKFRVSQSLNLKLTDLEKVAELVDVIALSEPYHMGALEFQNDKIGEIEREVQRAAAEDARRQAEEILAKTGGKLGAPLVIRFAPAYSVNVEMMYADTREAQLSSKRLAEPARKNFQPSKTRLSSSVQVTYQILPE